MSKGMQEPGEEPDSDEIFLAYKWSGRGRYICREIEKIPADKNGHRSKRVTLMTLPVYSTQNTIRHRTRKTGASPSMTSNPTTESLKIRNPMSRNFPNDRIVVQRNNAGENPEGRRETPYRYHGQRRPYMAGKRGRPHKNPEVPQEPTGESIVKEQPETETSFKCPCREDHSAEYRETGEDPGDWRRFYLWNTSFLNHNLKKINNSIFKKKN